ncbi:MFS transporter [Sulfolobus tengchongensis]|uniref:MFS transporter n=1 Tax=Sulfolobus tengchongensis TaxID=207809 RepID=A0AAX4L1W3_9CREN
MKLRILLLTSIAHFINDGNFWFLPVAYTFLVEYKGFSELVIGVISGLFFLSSALSSPLVTKFAENRGNFVNFIGLGIILWGIGIIMFGYATYINSLILLIVSILTCGIASSFYHPLGAASLAIVYKGSSGTAMGINGSLGSLGRTLYPTITLLIFTITERNILLTSIGVGLISILASIPALLSRTRLDIREPSSNNGNEKLTKSIRNIIIILLISALIRNMFSQGISQFLPTILVESYDFKYGLNLGQILSIALATAIVGQPLLGILSDKVGRRLIYGISTIGSIISILLFLVYPNIIYLSLFILFTYSAFPLVLSLVGDFVPETVNGFANALVWGLGSTGGGAIGPLIMGFLSQSIGLINATRLIVLIGLISVIVIPAIPKPPKRSKISIFG